MSNDNRALRELMSHIQLILSQVIEVAPVYTIRNARTTRLGLDVLDPRDAEVTSEQVVLLRTLYAQQPEELQAPFRAAHLDAIGEPNADVIVATMLQIGCAHELVTRLQAKPSNEDLVPRFSLWRALRVALCCMPQNFTDEELAALEPLRARDIKWAQKRSGEEAKAAVARGVTF